MERGHSREDITALGIQTGKDMHVKITVPTTQTGGIAGCMRVEHEAVLFYIPGRCGGTGIVDDKPNEIDDQKAKRKFEEGFFIAIEQIAGEGKRQGHPAEIKTTGGNVQKRSLMNQPEFVGRTDDTIRTAYAEQVFFEPVNALYMD